MGQNQDVPEISGILPGTFLVRKRSHDSIRLIIAEFIAM